MINSYRGAAAAEAGDLVEAACDPLHGRADTRTEGGDGPKDAASLDVMIMHFN